MWNVTPLYIMYNAVQQTYLGSKQNTYQWIAECHEMQTRRDNILCAALPHIKICRHSLSKIRATTMQHVVTHAARAGTSSSNLSTTKHKTIGILHVLSSMPYFGHFTPITHTNKASACSMCAYVPNMLIGTSAQGIFSDQTS